MQVRLIAKTVGYDNTEYKDKSIDSIIVGEARISSNRNTDELFDEPEKLLRHCILNGHYSIFEMANLTFEIETSRAMGRELLRHCKLVGVQERSQRYTSITGFEDVELRKQCKNNRQSSEEVLATVTEETHENYFDVSKQVRLAEVTEECEMLLEQSRYTYERCLEWGVSRETARFFLTECAKTTLIMNFRIRELITFLNVRLHKTAQKEIRLIAENIRDYFIKECPIISKSLFNFEDAYEIHILDRLVLEKFNVYRQIKNNNFKKIKHE